MGKKKASKELEKKVIKEKHKAPHLGVRALAELVKQKHNLNVSKSTVAKIIKEKGIAVKKGRKPVSLFYQQREVADCGLILLSCLDYYIGLFDYLEEEFSLFLPRLPKKLIKKFIVLASFGNFSKGSWKENIEKTGFLRLANLNNFPVKKFEYFKEKIIKYKPVVDLGPVKKKAIFISTLKFIFSNKKAAFCDPKMATFWDGVCKVSSFFLLEQAAINQVKRMLEGKVIIVGYTQSFGYLSALAADFIKGIESGISKIQFLDQKGKVVEELNCNGAKVAYVIGYSPKGLNKGVTIVKREGREKKLAWDELGGFYCKKITCKFLQATDKKEIIAGNVLIRYNRNTASRWGLLVASQGVGRDKLIKSYLYQFPGLDLIFKKGLKDIEKSFLISSLKPDLVDIFPSKLKFRNLKDFTWLAQILSTVFKEVVDGWEPRAKKGNFLKGKTYLKISLEKIPSRTRQKFNQASFYYEGKRAFLT